MYAAPHDHFATRPENKLSPIILLETNNHVRNLEPGQPIFFEGDTAKTIYQVMKGVVRTYKLTVDGRRQVVSFGYPGDIIGISHDGYYHNDCDAISDVTLQPLTPQADADFANNMLRYTVTEITNMQEHFLLLGRKSAMEKLASFLNVLQDRIGENCDGNICFSLPMIRLDIADFLGLTIETVSRCFSKLRQEGIIALPHPHLVCICDLTALVDLIEVDH
jgi:CRP-like cAMP-binding protein